MIVLIMSDKMPFTPPMLHVYCYCIGTFDRSTGFAGIRQSAGDDCRVWRGGHGGATKNPLYQANVKSAMISPVNKGSYRSYIVVSHCAALGASLAGTGATLLRANSVAGIHHIPYSKSYQHRN